MFRSNALLAASALLLVVSIVSGSADAQVESFSLSKTGAKLAESVTSLLWIEACPPHVFSDKKSVDNVERALFHKTQAELVTSSYVIDLSLQQPGIMAMPLILAEKDSRSWLQRNIFVSADPSSQLMKIGMTIDNPRNRQQIVAIVRAVTTAYLQVYHGQLSAERQRESQLLSNALASLAVKRRQASTAESRGAETKILDELWKDLYQRSVQNEANSLAGPRIRLLKMAGDGLKRLGQRSSASVVPASNRTAAPTTRSEAHGRSSFFSKAR